MSKPINPSLSLQAAGKIPIDVDAMKIDLMSLSGHKLYGPKGVGALYIRRRPRVRIEAQMSGGGQERGLRSGTVPTPLVVGFGAACSIAQEVVFKSYLFFLEQLFQVVFPLFVQSLGLSDG
jgi:cysteine sulfinate desulfinase/cysteine desulfurase-like protein